MYETTFFHLFWSFFLKNRYNLENIHGICSPAVRMIPSEIHTAALSFPQKKSTAANNPNAITRIPVTAWYRLFSSSSSLRFFESTGLSKKRETIAAAVAAANVRLKPMRPESPMHKRSNRHELTKHTKACFACTPPLNFRISKNGRIKTILCHVFPSSVPIKSVKTNGDTVIRKLYAA